MKECSQCMANTKEGRRCKNRTCKSGLCWIHLKRDKGLRIKPSSVQGLGQGLFVTRKFKKNERITEYTGERLSRAAIDRRYTGDTVPQYTLCSGNNPTSQCMPNVCCPGAGSAEKILFEPVIPVWQGSSRSENPGLSHDVAADRGISPAKAERFSVCDTHLNLASQKPYILRGK